MFLYVVGYKHGVWVGVGGCCEEGMVSDCCKSSSFFFFFFFFLIVKLLCEISFEST